jgi:hypothetical protein
MLGTHHGALTPLGVRDFGIRALKPSPLLRKPTATAPASSSAGLNRTCLTRTTARCARRRQPTLPHRIHRHIRYESLTQTNPKIRPETTPPPRAITATRKFPEIPANPTTDATSRPFSMPNAHPRVRFRPAARYNQSEPTSRPTPPVRTPPAPPRSALPASVSAGLQGTFCVAQGEAAPIGSGAALGKPSSRSETMEHSLAARRARLRIPHCSIDHRCYASGPLPRSINRQQPAKMDSVSSRSLRSPPRNYFASSNLSAHSIRIFNPN